MSPSEEPLTHDEIWDDSTLVRSWDDALEEYKKYHSIHRNGGNVEDLLSSNQTTSDAKNGADEAHEPSTRDGPQTDSEMRGDTTDGRQENGKSTIQHSHPLGGGPGPGGLLGSVQDEGLKRLLMSWYYAGYYTGLYEGQRQQEPPQQESEKR
ncbi:uncharacterized protein GGS25DRAFT_480873 [Hypoxylon fragiforme]|uniref:uncharacterized protein n=1 Tax=Hypoxylon fragiforme TaxID=63214 RepID=UPI0020C6710F|nr:uncharacterized protein GGS25DRAFT_480873 [Hypoxylon fragiforme]KAI2610978.1 hypothetical protein GGS25DRAFT_480873 [Hypoxylon fragiforme]